MFFVLLYLFFFPFPFFPLFLFLCYLSQCLIARPHFLNLLFNISFHFFFFFIRVSVWLYNFTLLPVSSFCIFFLFVFLCLLPFPVFSLLFIYLFLCLTPFSLLFWCLSRSLHLLLVLSMWTTYISLSIYTPPFFPLSVLFYLIPSIFRYFYFFLLRSSSFLFCHSTYFSVYFVSSVFISLHSHFFTYFLLFFLPAFRSVHFLLFLYLSLSLPFLFLFYLPVFSLCVFLSIYIFLPFLFILI